MNISQRTQSFLDRIPDHAITPVMKQSIKDAFTAADGFAARKAELGRAGTMTELGQRQALRDALMNDFGKTIGRARDPITKAKKEIQERRAAMKVKAVDENNQVAEMRRQEIRAYLRSLDPIALQTLALTTKSPKLLEAMVTAEPELSGFTGMKNAAELVEQVEARYFELHYGPEIAALEAMEAVVAEADAAVQVARNTVQSTVGMDDRSFNNVMNPIERKISAPWLLKSTANGAELIQVVNVGPDGRADYRPATTADIAEGVYYTSAAEYQAARSAA